MTSSNFYRKSVTTVGGMALALLFNAQALAAITYTGELTIGGTSSTYNITTDGTIGALSVGNIAGWDVIMSGPSGVTSYSNAFGTLDFVGSSLSATATDLLFDYGAAGSNFIQFNSFQGRHVILFEAGDVDRYAMRMNFLPLDSVGQTGVQSIASVPADPIGAVPEPSTWATMLLGFGAIGFSVRRRRKAVGIAQLA